MKCPNCNAELKGGKFCEFCGAQITVDMKKEQEQLNKAGCPKCGSSNVTFNREKQGEVQGKNGKAVVRATVGLCKDCGYTWNTSDKTTEKKKNNMVWWVLGWIFFFPAPVMILIWREKNKWPTKTKLIVTVVFWAFVLIFGAINNATQSTSSTSGTTENTMTETVEETDNTDETTAEPEETVDADDGDHLYNTAQVRDVMNGTRDKKLGEYAVIYADSTECTEKAIADIYFNYFCTHDFNWITLIYTDKNDDSGIYFNKAMIGVNDQFEKDEYGDYSVVESPNEELYVPNEDGKTIKKMVFDESAETDVESSDGVDPDLKAFLDSYEAYMDQYIEFMETYDANDLNLLAEYGELMIKYNDFAEKIDKYDTDTMSPADSAYYLEVVTRVNEKLVKVAHTQ